MIFNDITLLFLKTHKYVYKILTLPHASRIRAWLASMDCEPGYLSNFITLLGNTTQTEKWRTDVVDLNTKCYVSIPDYGAVIPDAEDNLAQESLVFMFAGKSSHWKCLNLYVVQGPFSADVQAQLIKDCIGQLYAKGL